MLPSGVAADSTHELESHARIGTWGQALDSSTAIGVVMLEGEGELGCDSPVPPGEQLTIIASARKPTAPGGAPGAMATIRRIFSIFP